MLAGMFGFVFRRCLLLLKECSDIRAVETRLMKTKNLRPDSPAGITSLEYGLSIVRANSRIMGSYRCDSTEHNRRDHACGTH